MAVLFRYPHFYSFFTAGTFLLFDSIDYILTGNSILRALIKKTNIKALFVFLAISTVFCFWVDYIYGVRLTKMWEWPQYKTVHFWRMYLVMNPTFVLGSYELYKIFKHLLRKTFNNKINYPKAADFLNQKLLNRYGMFMGILFLLLPLYILITPKAPLIEYAMLFPFISVLLIPDTITLKNKKEPFISKLVGFNSLEISAFIATVVISSITTEFLNTFAHEWMYINMPFIHIKVSGVPLSVFIGWIPLVAGTIAIVNTIKQNYLEPKLAKEYRINI
jgi:hypothetical protein